MMTMTMTAALAVKKLLRLSPVLPLCLLACGPTSSGDPGSTAGNADSEGWVDTGPPSLPPDRPGGDGDGDDEDEDEDEEAGTEVLWSLWGDWTDNQLGMELEGEVFVDENGQEVCILLFQGTLNGSLDDCTACEQAWEITLGAPEQELNEGGACERLVEDDVEGLVLRIGFAGEILYRDEGDGWDEVGEVFVEEGEIWLEWDAGE